MRNSRFRAYGRLLTLLIGGGLAFVASFNWAVDPYAIYTDFEAEDRLVGVGPYLRVTKPRLGERLAPRVVLAGSSRAEHAALPSYAEDMLGIGPAFNAALSSVSAYELRRNIEHLSAVAPVEVIVLGLDFFMFSPHLRQADSFTETRLAVNPDGSPNLTYRLADVLPTLITFDALNASRRATKRRARQGDDYWWPNGTLVSGGLARQAAKAGGSEKLFRATLTHYLTDPQLYVGFARDLSAEGTSSISNIDRLLGEARSREQRVILYISPVHALQLEAIDATGNWSAFENWKRELAHLATRHRATGLDVTLWDFADINAITREPVPVSDPSAGMNNFYDSHHVRPEIGRLMFARMLGAAEIPVPSDFGVEVTPAMLDGHLVEVRRHRAEWRARHAENMEFFEEVAADVRSRLQP